jgi:uncharacterized sulfatase
MRTGRRVALLLAAALLDGAAPARPPDRPNILWITCEDISPNLGCFGDAYAVTPNLDALAAQGVRYTRAFAPIGVCAPSRSSLILGMWAPSVGTQHMRSRIRLPDSIRLYSQYLREAGYYCTNNVKQDYNLDRTPPDAWDDSSRRAHWRNRKDPAQPFFAIFNLEICHESRIRMAEEEYRRRTQELAQRHDPARAPIPPYHPDAPEVRRDWARYADMITLMDAEVGRILAELDKDGLTERTIVFFYSDHGAGMPRSKRWLYESSLRVPMIIRFPKAWPVAPAPPGGMTDHLVSLVDLAPTVLGLAGVRAPATMQGDNFLAPRYGRPPRRYVFGFRDRMDERYDLLRSVRDERFHYIRNYLPHRPYAQHISYMYEMPTMQVWQRLHDEGKLGGPQRAFFEPKPPEELYDTAADPHEVRNLAADPAHQETLTRLRAALRQWILSSRDTGFLPEEEMHRRAGDRTIYEMARDPARYDLAKILDAAELASNPALSSDAGLIELIKNGDSAVRYWGATGLAMRPGSAAGAAALKTALADASPSVRIAAAEALGRIGRAADALPVLADALGHESEWVRLHAATVIDDLDEQARPILEQIKAAREREKKDAQSYAGRVLPKALKDLGVP